MKKWLLALAVIGLLTSSGLAQLPEDLTAIDPFQIPDTAVVFSISLYPNCPPLPPGAWPEGAALYYSPTLGASTVFLDDTQMQPMDAIPEFPPPGDDGGGDGDTNYVYQGHQNPIPSFPDSTNLYIAILSASAVPTDLASLALVNTSSNLVYMIQTSTNLNYTNWYDEGVVIGAPGTNTPFATFIGERTNQLFYRAYLLSTNPVGAIATLASGANCIASVNHGGTNTYSAFLGSLVGFSPPIYSLNFGFGDWDFMGSVYKTLAEDLAGHWENTPFPFPNEPQFGHQNAIGITFSEDTLATMTNLFLSGYSGEGNPITSLDLHGATGIEDVECWRLLRNDLRGLQAPVNQFKPWVGCVSAGLGRLLSAALGAQTLPCSVRGSAQATVRR
jgi:hypothetical protein